MTLRAVASVIVCPNVVFKPSHPPSVSINNGPVLGGKDTYRGPPQGRTGPEPRADCRQYGLHLCDRTDILQRRRRRPVVLVFGALLLTASLVLNGRLAYMNAA